MKLTPLHLTTCLISLALITACNNPYDFATMHTQNNSTVNSYPGLYHRSSYPHLQKQFVASVPSDLRLVNEYQYNPYSGAYVPPHMARRPAAIPVHAGQYAYNNGSRPVYSQQTPYRPRPSRYAHEAYTAYGARRGGLNLNYETLSIFESPLAKEIGDVTFLLRGRVDAPLTYSFESDDKFDATLVSNHQISAETQLNNRLTLGAVYAARAIENNGIEYDDEIAGYIGGSWGTVFGGNVSDLVHEETRRKRGASIIELAGDGPLGQLNEWSGGYRGRYGPVIVSALLDENKNYDVGLTFQRPIGNKDYRLTARHNNGTFIAEDGITEIETKSINAIGEYVYGSSRYDIGGGIEKLSNAGTEVDRWYTSAGFTTKHGLWSLSAEGHYGKIDGQEEVSGLLGIRYDIARGLAATAALDYQDRQINIGGVDYIDNKDTRAIFALSYGF